MNIKAFFRRLIFGILIGGVIGALLGFMLAFASEEQLQIISPVLITLTITAFILYLAYIIINAVKFTKETKRLLKILFEEIDIEKYIKETEAAISKTRNKQYKLNYSLNLALGYDASGDYEKAINYTHSLYVKDSMWIYKAIYYNNLAFFYCETGNLQKAMETYSLGEIYIKKLLKNPMHSAGPLHTIGAIEYLKGNLSESEDMLEKSKLQLNASSHLITSANIIIAKICMQTDRKEKARLLLDYNLSQRLLPNILMETKKTIGLLEHANNEKHQ